MLSLRENLGVGLPAVKPALDNAEFPGL